MKKFISVFCVGVLLFGCGDDVPVEPVEKQAEATAYFSRSIEVSGKFQKGATVVVSVSGEVSILEAARADSNQSAKPAPSTERSANANEVLSPGDQVRTGAGAEALLLFSNGSTVTVGPDTQVRIDGFVQEEFEGSDQKVGALAAEVSSSRMKLDLEVGELIIGVKKLNKESSLIVSTSMGMAGVRGTHFKIAANKDQTSVCVLSGAVDFQNLKNETRSIAKETKVEATKDALSKPVAIPAVDKARIEAAQQAAKQKTEAVSLGELSEAFDEMNPKQGEVRSDADLKRYFADLENAVQNNTYQGVAQAAAQAMTAKRGLFANDRGQLQLKLLFDGPEEVWGKVKAGGVGVLPVNTRLEFEHLSAVAGAMGMRDMWRYKLYQCTPVVGDKRPGNPQRYDTKKKLIQEIFSFGKIQEERAKQNFDAKGQRVQNPSVKLIQQGSFLINGKLQGRLFESTHFDGGIKGNMLEEPELTAETKFVQQQLERRLDASKHLVLAPLIDLVDGLVSDQASSSLFKAYLHRKVYEAMLLRGDEWGARMSSTLKQDHEQLNKLIDSPLKDAEWMNPAACKIMKGRLDTYYQDLAKRGLTYGQELKFKAGFLRQLATASIRFAGHVDKDGQPRYRQADKPPAHVWCLGPDLNEGALQRFNGSNAATFSPLLTIDKNLDELHQKALSEAGVDAKSLWKIEDLVPFRYATK